MKPKEVASVNSIHKKKREKREWSRLLRRDEAKGGSLNTVCYEDPLSLYCTFSAVADCNPHG